ncbi:MAG TPA: ABC transporter permease, partial [Longimicrobiales bacterium]|nr:ABC transporter permease [Longimicrobiales bacterium]
MMGWFWRWYERLRTLVFRKRVERELDQEMRFHLEMEIRRRIDTGMDPREARRTAHRDFGGVDRWQEKVREGRWTRVPERVLRDARYALRTMAARPTFTAVVVLTLGVGIGAATTIFSAVDGVLLRPLPYPDDDDLLRIRNSWAGSSSGALSPAEYVDYVAWLGEFEAVGAYGFGGSTFNDDDGTERLPAAFVSAGVLPALGVEPALGRAFTPEEDHAGAPVVILTDGLWRSRFGADPGVVGRTFRSGGVTVEVIGVLAPDFRLPEDLASDRPTRVLFPLGIDPAAVDPAERGSHFLASIARKPPGMSMAEAERLVSDAAARMVRTWPDEYPAGMEFGATAVPLDLDVVGDVRPYLLLLLAAVAVVYLIVCVNLANLFLGRAEERRREFAVRQALGAARGRLVSQLVVEGLLLAMVGGALGVFLGAAGTDLLAGLAPASLPRGDTLSVDGRVVAFGLALAGVAGLVFGTGPAFRSGDSGVAGALRDGRSGGGGPAAQRLRRALVGAQIALAVVLAAGAALLARSFAALSSVDPGYRTEGVVSARVSLPSSWYPSDDEVVGFHRALAQRLGDLPSASATGAVTNLPLATSLGDMGFELEEEPIPEGRDMPDADWQVVTPGYFEAMDVDVLRGRGITGADRSGGEGVVVVNATMADRFWPGRDPVGRRIRLGGQRTEPRWARVVGIVEDVRHGGLDEVEARPQMYFAHEQFRFWSDASPVRTLTFVVRSSLPPEEVRRGMEEALAAMDPQLPLFDVRVMEEVVATSLAVPRILSTLVVGFSAVALLLAIVGVYGVTAYAVGRRTREFGIRIALGAAPADLRGTVLAGGLRLTTAGAALGLVTFLAVAGGLRSFLYGVEAT